MGKRRGLEPEPQSRAERYATVRAHSEALCAPLSAEDMCVQCMPDASPAKWHLAHTTWFFETFVLSAALEAYAPFDARYGYLFNSYYEGLGPRHARPERGLLTRPALAEIIAYRRHVDAAMARLLAGRLSEETLRRLEIGLQHEEQHQELILTDILALFATNPLGPAYRDEPPTRTLAPGPLGFVSFPGGLHEIGADPQAGFAWDNEHPRHAVYLRPFALADRLITCGEWLAFIEDGGYATPALWLSDGWASVTAGGWRAPAYWRDRDGDWAVFGLSGLHPMDAAAPVRHVSYYEADAFARWSGARLPTEAEWETAATARPAAFADLRGAAWQWTQSAYAPYPAYRPPAGALGEYNGKFMVNQQVLRGGSSATPPGHARPSYRNFFHPHQRWQFTGVRLAREID